MHKQRCSKQHSSLDFYISPQLGRGGIVYAPCPTASACTPVAPYCPPVHLRLWPIRLRSCGICEFEVRKRGGAVHLKNAQKWCSRCSLTMRALTCLPHPPSPVRSVGLGTVTYSNLLNVVLDKTIVAAIDLLPGVELEAVLLKSYPIFSAAITPVTTLLSGCFANSVSAQMALPSAPRSQSPGVIAGIVIGVLLLLVVVALVVYFYFFAKKPVCGKRTQQPNAAPTGAAASATPGAMGAFFFKAAPQSVQMAQASPMQSNPMARPGAGMGMVVVGGQSQVRPAVRVSALNLATHEPLSLTPLPFSSRSSCPCNSCSSPHLCNSCSSPRPCSSYSSPRLGTSLRRQPLCSPPLPGERQAARPSLPLAAAAVASRHLRLPVAAVRGPRVHRRRHHRPRPPLPV